ncbi:hypothetical protein [Variovorax paradoxus]|uniref:hypothetical protein n=1 Tax=Variovorax paradoxus TaxID=34073 RepID=UPI000FB0B5DE|nr:hypothetical protein [Variovorax paradoxus]
MNRNNRILSSSNLFGLSTTTLDALQLAADRKRDREEVQRARDRKVPVPYAQRAVKRG